MLIILLERTWPSSPLNATTLIGKCFDCSSTSCVNVITSTASEMDGCDEALANFQSTLHSLDFALELLMI